MNDTTSTKSDILNKPAHSVKPILNEDWTAVIAGFLIIILALVGIVLPVPTFG